jgi:hypothetical protein
MRARLLTASLLILAACENPPPLTPQPPAPPPIGPTATPLSSASPQPASDKLDRVARLAFNRLAAQLDLPLFWISDEKNPGTLDDGELAVSWGITSATKATYIDDHGGLTPAGRDAYERIVKEQTATIAEGPDAARRRLVLEELNQSRPSLIRSDFTKSSGEDKALVEHILKAAEVIERLYQKQLGVLDLDKEIPADDAASRMLFYRNHGPYCAQPNTEKNPACKALARDIPKISGLYPKAIQTGKFCETLEARKDAKTLLSPFTVVVDEGGKLVAKQLTDVWKDDMAAVSRELKAAADSITSPGEAALKAYLLADAKAFTDNNWNPADEAWAKMTNENSKWYLRIAPDETYGDTCSHKGGFQVSFARINQDSVAWQKRLDPVKGDMEEALATLTGAPYKSRKAKVSFHLPDFIDIVLNAGDARSPAGATVGESLPNWGPVANEGRGRTVAMTNIAVDQDSVNAMRERLESAFCRDTISLVNYDPSLSTMATVLHEASHNLGPAHEYKVKGKTDEQVFGGPMAATFEELKAQTSALYFADWLLGKGLIDKKMVEQSHIREMVWAFGHISEGMYTGDGKPKPYAQLAAIQVGHLIKAGAVTWNKDEAAPNGKDKGCISIHLDKFAPAIVELEKQVLGIKGRGDKDGAHKLIEQYVDVKGDLADLHKVVEERWRRQPQGTFVYAIDR